MPSSRDNHAAFSFAIMGAKVISEDISERQLKNAKMIAGRIGLDIEFVCDNTMELGHIKDNAYDLVYTSNGPFSGEAWKDPKIIKSYHDVMPDFHWRVQDIVNANIMAGLSINELAELPAVDASFWFTYDELIKKVRRIWKTLMIGTKIRCQHFRHGWYWFQRKFEFWRQLCTKGC